MMKTTLSLLACLLFTSIQAKAGILLPGGSPDPTFSGLNVWYDAGSIGVEDGNPIDSWQSSAATPNTATALVSSRRPTLVTSGLGGLPAVAFDGLDDQLRMATSYFTGWPPLELTIFAVLQTEDTSAHVIGTGSDGAGYLHSYGYGLVIDESPALKANFTSNGVYLQATTTDLSNGGLVTSIASDAESAISINGLLENTDSVNNLNPYYLYTHATLGASGSSNAQDPFAGSISEILIYGSLTSTEIDQVNDYLMGKYFPVPEPSSFLLAAFGSAALCVVAFRRRRAMRSL